MTSVSESRDFLFDLVERLALPRGIDGAEDNLRFCFLRFARDRGNSFSKRAQYISLTSLPISGIIISE